VISAGGSLVKASTRFVLLGLAFVGLAYLGNSPLFGFGAVALCIVLYRLHVIEVKLNALLRERSIRLHSEDFD
jgi:hypothetical protein